MANRIERKIHRLLTVGKTSQSIFDELTVDLFQKKITIEERSSIFNFAMNSGLYQQLLSNFVETFHEKAPVPWGQYIELLDHLKVSPNREVIESVIKGARRQKNLDSLACIVSWDRYDKRFAEVRSEIEKKRKEDHDNKKQVMIEKIEFYRSQRMVEEEKRALKVLLKMFPNDPTIQEEHERFQRQWAREVIAQNSRVHHEIRLVERARPSKEELQIVKCIVDEMLRLVGKNNKQAYNFAIALKTMGHPESALKVLDFADDVWEVEWLRIDLLIDGGRFIDCLNAVHDLEVRHAHDPESTFAATYARARALNGLGQSGPAIDLLQSIVSVRPNYRSAYSLMAEWAGKNL